MLEGDILTGSVTITPSDSGGGGSFVPTSVSLTTAAPSDTFTYIPTTTGTKTIQTTNNRDLVNPSSVSYESNAEVEATSYTFTGPATAPIGTASSLFTITPTTTPTLSLSGTGINEVGTYVNSATFNGTIRITDSRGGYTDYVFSSSAPQTFSVTATNETFTLTPTCISGGLTNPSAISVTGQTLTTINSSWLADTGNGGPNGPYQLTLSDRYYKLAADVTVPGNAFVLSGSGLQRITLDGDGHTITYDQATTTTVSNNSFETGNFTGWDVSGASGASVVAAGVGYYGSYMAEVSATDTPQTILSPTITLPETGINYRAGFGGVTPQDYNSRTTLQVVDASTGNPIQTPLIGTVNVQNGSKTVTGTQSFVLAAPPSSILTGVGTKLIFASQPGSVYTVDVVNAANQVTLVEIYTGSSNTATTGVVLASIGPRSAGLATNINFVASVSNVKIKFVIAATTGNTTIVNFDMAFCRRTDFQGIVAPTKTLWLRNFTLTQGTAKSCASASNSSAAIEATASTLALDNITINSGSIDNNVVNHQYAENCIVRNCTFNAQVEIITNRQSAQSIYYLFNASNVILFEHNVLTGTHQNGLCITGMPGSTTSITSGLIQYNTINQEAVWTNCYSFGIGTWSGQLEYRYNTCIPVAGRGIIFDQGYPNDHIDNITVHDNYVRVKERGDLEYGQLGLIATALRWRNWAGTYSNINVYNNKFYAYTGVGVVGSFPADGSCSGFALSAQNEAIYGYQMANAGATCHFHDNHFKAIVTESDPALSPLLMQGYAGATGPIDAGINMVFSGNTYESNVAGIVFGYTDGGTQYDLIFKNCTIIKNTTEGEARTFHSMLFGNNGTSAMDNVYLIDFVYQNSAPTLGTFVCSVPNTVRYGWTLNLTVTRLVGGVPTPVPGASVTITDTNGTGIVQFSDTTDSNGQCLDIQLVSDKYSSDGASEYNNNNPIHVDYNDFSVHAEYSTYSGTQSITMSSPAQTMTLAIS